MKNIVLPLLIGGSFSGIIQAASYSSNFDSNPYVFGSNMNGLDGWSLSGASLSDVAVVASSPFPAPVSGSQGIRLGFQEIDASSAYLSRNYGSGLVVNPAGYTEFQASFILADSEPPFVNRDAFSFAFRGSSNENLLKVTMAPTSQSGSPQGVSPPRVDQFSWDSAYAAGNSNIGYLSEGQWSIINVLFTPSGASDVAFSVKFFDQINDVFVEAASGTLAGAASQNLETYGFVWTPLDPNNEGANNLYLDDVSLVPEPSSALLVALAGLCFVSRRRRA